MENCMKLILVCHPFHRCICDYSRAYNKLVGGCKRRIVFLQVQVQRAEEYIRKYIRKYIMPWMSKEVCYGSVLVMVVIMIWKCFKKYLCLKKGQYKTHDVEAGQVAVELEREIRNLKQKHAAIIQEHRSENLRLQKELEASVSKVQHCEEQLMVTSHLRQELNTKFQEAQMHKQQLSQKDSEKKALLGQKDEDIRRLQEEVDKLTKQLGQDMNRRLAADETALENINKKNRPTRIVDEYMDLMSIQWLGAKDKLDELYPDDSQEEFKLKFLCHILVEAEALASKTLQDYKGMLQQALQDPITAVSKSRSHQSTEDAGVTRDTKSAKEFDARVLGDDLKDLLSAFIKDNSDTAESHKLAQALVQNLQARGSEWRDVMTKLRDNQELIAYIKDACVLCWKMATQRPPMTFDLGDVGVTPTKDRHVLYYKCCHDKTAIISSYIYPALNQGEKQLVQGKVFTVPQAEFEQKPIEP